MRWIYGPHDGNESKRSGGLDRSMLCNLSPSWTVEVQGPGTIISQQDFVSAARDGAGCMGCVLKRDVVEGCFSFLLSRFW